MRSGQLSLHLGCCRSADERMTAEDDFVIEEVRDLDTAWPVLEPLLLESHAYYMPIVGCGPPDDWRREVQEGFQPGAAALILLAKVANEAAAFANAAIRSSPGSPPQRFAYLDNVYVREGMRGRGIGQASPGRRRSVGRGQRGRYDPPGRLRQQRSRLRALAAKWLRGALAHHVAPGEGLAMSTQHDIVIEEVRDPGSSAAPHLPTPAFRGGAAGGAALLPGSLRGVPSETCFLFRAEQTDRDAQPARRK